MAHDKSFDPFALPSTSTASSSGAALALTGSPREPLAPVQVRTGRYGNLAVRHRTQTLQKPVEFFDSGDWMMSKRTGRLHPVPVTVRTRGGAMQALAHDSTLVEATRKYFDSGDFFRGADSDTGVLHPVCSTRRELRASQRALLPSCS